MTTVDTRYGPVEGVEEGGLTIFRGIPYAAPPVGELRFRPPQPPQPWTDVRRCDEFSCVAPQPPPIRQLTPGEPLDQAEDCLALNIWTSGLDGAGRPVMVWIHGGAFVTGSGASPLYRGHHLAQRGDVVVVTINYRLGALGFLAHPDLRDEETGAAGNWGILDQIAALQWVQEHIAKFGGDPENVTIFGESAGSMSVSTLLGLPQARGLFNRAIAESGGPGAASLERATAVAEEVASELGLDGVAALRDVDAKQLLAAQNTVYLRRYGSGLSFTPVIDGAVITRQPLAEIRDGNAEDVQVLAGTNLEEMKYFLVGDRSAAEMDEGRLVGRLRASLGDKAERIVEEYRRIREARSESTAPVDLWVAIASDYTFRIPTIRMLEAQRATGAPAYAYLFTWKSPALKGFLGSCHALEIPFVFGTLTAEGMDRFTGSGPDALRLSENMQDAWISFARTGDPGKESSIDWPVYDEESRQTVILDAEIRVADAPLDEERQLWDGLKAGIGA